MTWPKKQPWIVGRQRSFLGGETQAALPEMVGRDQLLRLENAVLNENGTISELMRMNEPLLTNATGGVALVRLPMGTYDAYWASGNNIYFSNFSTLYSTPVNVLTGIQSGCTGCYIKGIQLAVPFLGKQYVPNPNPDNSKNGVLNLTDKTLALIPGKTSNKLRKYMNRLWVVNSDGTIQISDNGDAAVWNPLNIIWLPNQEPAIDFVPVQGGTIVYSQNSIYAMYGADYTDISFTLILTDQNLSSGAVLVDNTVYIPSVRGVVRTTLNASELIPHEQETYFKSNFFTLSKQAHGGDIVVGCYLQRLRAILFTWSSAVGGPQAFILYLEKGAYSKVNQVLSSAYPSLLALNDTYVDALVGTSAGVVSGCRPNTGVTVNTAYLQTRHEDCDSSQDKVWRTFTISVEQIVAGVTISAYLDQATTATPIAAAQTLVKGENHFWLDIPRSKTISFLVTIAGSAFTIQELRIKYRTAGPEE